MGLFEKIFGKPAQATQPAVPMYPIYQMLNGYQPAFTNSSGAVYEDALIRATIHAAAKHCSKLSVEFTGHGASGQNGFAGRISCRPGGSSSTGHERSMTWKIPV